MSSSLLPVYPTRKEGLMKTTLLMLLFVTAASPVLADPHRANRAAPDPTF